MRLDVGLDGELCGIEEAAHGGDDAGDVGGLIGFEGRRLNGRANLIQMNAAREGQRFGSEGGAGGSGVAPLAVWAENQSSTGSASFRMTARHFGHVTSSSSVVNLSGFGGEKAIPAM